MASIKSQLAGKTVNKPHAATVESTFAQFVLGDIKGGTHAHEYRMTTVSTAIREALKGNSRALTEATALATGGKSKKALSYFDGFAAVGIPARITYTGKLSDPANKPVVERIEQETTRLAHEFEVAFLTRYHAPAEPKAKTKGKGTAPVADEPTAPADTNDATDTGSAAPTVELSASELVSAMVEMIRSNVATDAEVDTILAAITLRRAMAVAPAAVAETAEA